MKRKETELWLNLNEYDYSISSYGRVRNDKTNHILKGKLNLSGYLQVALRREGTVKWVLIHRLVAEYFVPNLMGGDEIDHINRNKTDNNYLNLRWVSSSENKRYIPKEIRRKGSPRRKIVQKDLQGNFIREWNSINEAATTLSYCSTCIRWCCTGRSKTYKNYLWEYVEKGVSLPEPPPKEGGLS